MKKRLSIFVLLCVLLTGCSAAETFETLGLVQHQPEAAPIMATVQLSLPESAAAAAFGDGDNSVYDCDGYTVMLQTRSSGDFRGTVQSLSGFSPEKLTVVETQVGKTRRYDWAWTAAGEEGDVICRASVLDDGNYHYCLTSITSAQNAGRLSEEWNQLFASFTLE